MAQPTVITNPTPKTLKLFEAMRNHKHQQLEKVTEMERGIFSIRV